MIGLFGVSSGSAAVKPAKLPLLLEKVEAKYTAAKTMKADFTQKNDSAILQKSTVSTGKLSAKRPGKVRWETLEPDKNLLVSNGQKFWFYQHPMFEDERGQVIVSKSSSTVPPLANALLAGSFSMVRQMKIDQKTPSRFALIPNKKGTAGTVILAEIEIRLADKLIEKVILEHKGGNHTEMTLTNIQLGDDIPDSMFTFVAPANTDEVDPAKERSTLHSPSKSPVPNRALPAVRTP